MPREHLRRPLLVAPAHVHAFSHRCIGEADAGAPSRQVRRDAQSSGAGREILAAQDFLQLLLVHPRATFDAALLGLVSQLVIGPAARAAVRPQPAPAPRGDVTEGGRAGFPRLAVTRALLVDRPGGDLLRPFLVGAAVEESFLDVFVLTFALVAPGALGHGNLLFVFCLDNAPANPFD